MGFCIAISSILPMRKGGDTLLPPLAAQFFEKTINLWGMVDSGKNRKNNQPVRCSRLRSTCIIIKSTHLAAFGDWHDDNDSGWLSRKNRKNNQPVRCGWLQKKQKKQSTCEVWSTLEKTEKTINLWGVVDSGATASSSKAWTWLHSETVMMMTTTPDDSWEKTEKN